MGSVVRYIYNINEKHPEKPATPIDYGIVIVMLPMVILGSFTGVLANIMFPEITITILLTIVQILLTVQSLIQACKRYRIENQSLHFP